MKKILFRDVLEQADVFSVPLFFQKGVGFIFSSIGFLLALSLVSKMTVILPVLQLGEYQEKEISQVLRDHQAKWDKLFGKYFIQNKYQNEGYLMFARAK